MQTATFPFCPHCGREFAPGASWHGANFCKGLYLLPIIGSHPGASSWELSQVANIPYGDTQKGLLKLRDFQAVEYVAEEKDGGGQRFRYHLSQDKTAIRRFMDAVNATVR